MGSLPRESSVLEDISTLGGFLTSQKRGQSAPEMFSFLLAELIASCSGWLRSSDAKFQLLVLSRECVFVSPAPVLNGHSLQLRAASGREEETEKSPLLC